MRKTVPLFSIIILGMVSCWGPSKDKVLAKAASLETRIQALEDEFSADDKDLVALLARGREDLASIQDLIIEDDLKGAMAVLDDLTAALDRKVKRLRNPVVAEDAQMGVFGKVEYRSANGSYQPFSQRTPIADVKHLRTSIRSGAIFELMPKCQLVVTAQSELAFLANDPQGRRFRIQLKKGRLLLRKNGPGKVSLEIDDFQAVLENKGEMELFNDQIVKTKHVAVFSGTVQWQEGQQKGTIDAYQGRLLSASGGQQHGLPVRPVLDAPIDNAQLAAVSDQTPVTFRWHASVQIPEIQIQISEKPHFMTRVIDQAVEGGGASFPLEEGTYFWRLRGLSKEGLPGPYSSTARFSVKSPRAGEEDEFAESGKKKGPPIVNVNIQVINSMAIISGRTASYAKVNVNGVTAVMNEGGNFRAILNFYTEGDYDLKIIATDTNTGGETILERKVKINL